VGLEPDKLTKGVGMADVDCIVVGARCAGAALAVHLARAGLRVLVFEADSLRTDQPFSTHAIQSVGMDLLDELGVGASIRALTPAVRATRLEVCGRVLDVPLAEGRFMYCPRRSTLDPLLQDAAISAGAELRPNTRVTALLRDGDRVCGVRAEHAGKAEEYRARWVIGADGRNSSVARMVGARNYIEHVSERGGYWGYWPKPECWDRDEPWRRFQTVISLDETGRFAFECDGGLLIMGAMAPTAEARGWGKHYPEELRKSLRASPLTAALCEAEPVGPLVGMLKAHFFMREPVGPGWALVGDAGVHMDATPGHGITDALRDAATLAHALIDGRDEALDVYWRERDVGSLRLYFQALDMGRLSFANPFNAMLIGRVNDGGSELIRRMQQVLDRQRSPFDLVPSLRVLGWLAKAVLRGQSDVVLPFLASARATGRVEREHAKCERLLAKARTRLENSRARGPRVAATAPAAPDGGAG
jgi:flavin-dependent dehydrogenase